MLLRNDSDLERTKFSSKPNVEKKSFCPVKSLFG